MSFSKYLQPVARRAMSRQKAMEVNKAIAEAGIVKAKRRARKAAVVVGAEQEILEPIDLKAYAAFIKSWREEMKELPEHEQELLAARIRPYFRGRHMGDEWRAILSLLHAVRHRDMKETVGWKIHCKK